MKRRFLDWLRDLRRGYTDADLRSMIDKVRAQQGRRGGVIFLNEREMRAYRAHVQTFNLPRDAPVLPTW